MINRKLNDPTNKSNKIICKLKNLNNIININTMKPATEYVKNNEIKCRQIKQITNLLLNIVETTNNNEMQIYKAALFGFKNNPDAL